MMLAWMITIIATMWITHAATKAGLQQDINSTQDAAMFLAARLDEVVKETGARLDEVVEKMGEEEWEMLPDDVLYKCAGSIQSINIDEYDEEIIEHIFENLKARADLDHWTEEDLQKHYEETLKASKE